MNYIQLEDLKIELTEEQVKQIREQASEKIELSTVEVGDTFTIAGHEFIVLEQFDDATAVISRDIVYDDEKFGENNNYNGSNVDKLCNDFLTDIQSKCNEEIFIEHTVDLTSDDGLKDYGEIKRKMSLLTAEMYRKYVYILDKHKIDAWWWLATAYSTKTHNSENYVKCVSPSGNISGSNYYYDDIGFRPFCILKSNIFVSK